MENGELLQLGGEWYPILPPEELPEGVDNWMRDIPSVGNLFVTLENKPGGTGFEDDNRVYTLRGDGSEILINGGALLDRGFRVLNVALTTSDARKTQEMQLGLNGIGAKFETVLERRDNRGPLKLLAYWNKAGDKGQSMSDLRDVMISRDQLKEIQVRFPQGGEV